MIYIHIYINAKKTKNFFFNTRKSIRLLWVYNYKLLETINQKIETKKKKKKFSNHELPLFFFHSFAIFFNFKFSKFELGFHSKFQILLFVIVGYSLILCWFLSLTRS